MRRSGRFISGGRELEVAGSGRPFSGGRRRNPARAEQRGWLRFQATDRADDDAVGWTAVGVVADGRQDHLEGRGLHPGRVENAGERVEGGRPLFDERVPAELDLDEAARAVPKMDDRVAFQSVPVQEVRDRSAERIRVDAQVADGQRFEEPAERPWRSCGHPTKCNALRSSEFGDLTRFRSAI